MQRRRNPCRSSFILPVLSRILAGGSSALSLSSDSSPSSRRALLVDAAASGLAFPSLFFLGRNAHALPPNLSAANVEEAKDPATFRSLAYGQAEYTNSITASRDTNLSPLEAYDVLRQRIPPAESSSSSSSPARALDLGAGAGLSTAVLYQELGYKSIDAVDWSDAAWKDRVIEQPESVRFFAMDDDSFFRLLQSQESPRQYYYQAIVYNFAVNLDKAVRVAQTYLDPSAGGGGSVLLAPVNDRTDYWYKQSYVLLDATGRVLWKSDPEVGAWSVQFQPDVTSDTCTGIWCGNANGFQQKKTARQ